MSGKNKLNLLDISLIVVSLVIGMGIFRNPASVAATSGSRLLLGDEENNFCAYSHIW